MLLLPRTTKEEGVGKTAQSAELRDVDELLSDGPAMPSSGLLGNACHYSQHWIRERRHGNVERESATLT